MDQRTEESRGVVLAFYEMAFREKDVAGAAARFMRADYRQHNAAVPDGSEAFTSAVSAILDQSPHTTFDLKRVVAEDDLVVLHFHLTTGAGDLGHAIVDIFRVEDRLIVEHWDVVQAVPPDSANDNTMF
jgi:predicted SnoaL-like aldol condensation-catalyzing enzyme